VGSAVVGGSPRPLGEGGRCEERLLICKDSEEELWLSLAPRLGKSLLEFEYLDEMNEIKEIWEYAEDTLETLGQRKTIITLSEIPSADELDELQYDGQLLIDEHRERALRGGGSRRRLSGKQAEPPDAGYMPDAPPDPPLIPPGYLVVREGLLTPRSESIWVISEPAPSPMKMGDEVHPESRWVDGRKGTFKFAHWRCGFRQMRWPLMWRTGSNSSKR
jgi:hypothetical protein